MVARNTQRTFYGRVVALLLIGWLALLRFMLMLPPLEGSDEIAHFGYIAYVRQNGHFPPLETDNPIVLQETGQPPLYYGIVTAWSVFEPDFDWHTWQGKTRQNLWADFHKPVRSLDNVNQFMLGQYQVQSTDSPGVERAILWLRFPSLMMGMLTIACAIAAARRLFDNSMALFTGAIFTFTITLIYIFSIITNDSLMILSATAVTYGCVRLLTLPEFSARTALMTGIVAAVGVLTKANGLLFLPVMGLALLTLPVQSFRKLLIRALILLLIPAMAMALWYGYMLITYHDPLGSAAHMNRSWVRPEPIDILSALPLNEYLSLRSFWGGMAGGYLIPGNWIFIVPIAALILAVYGAIRQWRGFPPNRADAHWILRIQQRLYPWRVSLILGVICLGMLLAYMRWMTQFYVLSGRLMLPGYLAFILLLVMGLRGVAGFRYLRLVMVAWSGFVTVIYAGYIIYPQVFGVQLIEPSAVPALQGSPIRYGDIELMGYQIAPKQLHEGDSPQVMLCWRSLKTDEPLAVPDAFSFQIVGLDDTIYYRRESHPGMGSYTLWQPGLAFCDRFSAESVTPVHPATAYRVIVQLFDPETGDLRVSDNEMVQTGMIAAPGAPLASDTVPLIDLEGVYVLNQSVKRESDRLEITVEWAAGQWQPRPVTVFFHVMMHDELLTQHDSPLIEGYPSALWGQNEHIGTVTYTIPLPPETEGETLSLYTGVYGADGSRLTVTRSDYPTTSDHRILSGTFAP